MDLLIFDLDGTLVDTKQDLINSVNAARTFLGMSPLPDDRVASYVGRGAHMLIRQAVGPEASEETVAEALEFFLAHYKVHMLDYSQPYPGVPEALDRFRDAGKSMAILTNKPVRFSTAMIEQLGFGGHFFRIYGGNSFEQKKPHPIGVEKLLEEKSMEPLQALMIGDSAVDVQTARNAGIACCGVRWGFQPESFAADPPDFVVDRMVELVGRLLPQ
jgi:phosphoglycolate phosphatase